MDGELTLTWVIRFLHVLFAAIWTGGYALLALAVVPLLRGGALRIAGAARALDSIARFLSLAGTLTMVFGALLIWRTRGYGQLMGNEWGGIILASIAIAIVVMGIGDSLLRPSLRRMAAAAEAAAAGGSDPAGASAAPSLAQRWSLVGTLLLLLAIAFMTRALYASS